MPKRLCTEKSHLVFSVEPPAFWNPLAEAGQDVEKTEQRLWSACQAKLRLQDSPAVGLNSGSDRALNQTRENRKGPRSVNNYASPLFGHSYVET